jgi:hypothetical protein
MRNDLKYERENIELRRARVLELIAKGHSQTEIATALNCSPALISLDLQWIRERSKRELETHISDKLPFEYARAMEGLNGVLKRISDIEDAANDTKTKLECSKLKMDLYRSIMSLATDGSIIERAIKMVRVVSPLPGEDIPAESQEEKEQKDRVDTDIITEESVDVSTGEDPPTEPEDIPEEE